MTQNNLKEANDVIFELAAETYKDAEELLGEFLDRVEEDDHIVYELKRIRKYREMLCQIQSLIGNLKD